MGDKGFKVAKLVFHSKGFKDLMLGQGVRADLERRAKAIAAAAGDGFEHGVGKRRDRNAAYARTGNRKARAAEASNSVLTSAIGAGRG